MKIEIVKIENISEEEKLKISDFVNQTSNVTFEYIRSGNSYYSVVNNKNHKKYIFPVPFEDMGNATFNKSDKTITFMRWIRKAIDGNMMNEK